MAEQADAGDSFYIGQRVMIGEEMFGTVAYIGCIPGSKFKWLGVDWDDPERGRHDGTHQGVRYFTTRHPTSGSFVRPNKVTSGVGLLEAIDMRYCRGWEQLQELQRSGLICNTQLPFNDAINSNVSTPNDRDASDQNQIINPAKETKSYSSPLLPADKRRFNQPFKFTETTMVSGLDPQDNPFAPSDTSNLNSESNNSSGSRGKVQIELVGFSDIILTREDLQRQKQMLLNCVPLSSCTLEEAQRCREFLPNVFELNISRTLIDEWITVANVCDGFPKLTILSVSDNCFRMPIVEADSDSDHSATALDPLKYIRVSESQYQHVSAVFQNISKLVAVRLHYTWEQFCTILQWFQSLNHLVLAFNKINLIPSAIEVLPSCLRVLDLAGNVFNTRESTQTTLLSISLLPNLEVLYMNECQLTDFILPVKVAHEEGDHCQEIQHRSQPNVQKPLPPNIFPRLKVLSLCQNQIQTWDTVNHLNRLPTLEELSFMDNPIFSSCNNYDTARQYLVARVARIHSLNRSEISKEERRGAELDYLRAYGREWLQAMRPGSPQIPDQMSNEALEKKFNFIEAHPRYEELVQLHGAPEVAELKQFTCALREGLLAVSIHCPSLPESKVFDKKLPSRMTVQHLHSLVRRIFRIPSHQAIRLTYTHYRKPGVEYPLEAPTREVGFYEIENGDGIQVHFV